jgi:hypothetical protein
MSIAAGPSCGISVLRLAVGKRTPPSDLLDHLERELLGTLPEDQRDLVGAEAFQSLLLKV